MKEQKKAAAEKNVILSHAARKRWEITSILYTEKELPPPFGIPFRFFREYMHTTPVEIRVSFGFGEEFQVLWVIWLAPYSEQTHGAKRKKKIKRPPESELSINPNQWARESTFALRVTLKNSSVRFSARTRQEQRKRQRASERAFTSNLNVSSVAMIYAMRAHTNFGPRFGSIWCKITSHNGKRQSTKPYKEKRQLNTAEVAQVQQEHGWSWQH